MKQKFFRGQRVKLDSKFPKHMDHFGGKGVEAIVVASYSDLYGGGNFSSFQLLILDRKHYYNSAWYPEDLMTLISDNRKAGEVIIQMHNEDLIMEEVYG